MWNLISIPLTGGVGNGNLIIPRTRVLGGVAIPTQTAIISGSTKVVLSHILPDGSLTAFPILTLTTVTTPYNEIAQKKPVDPTNTQQSSTNYQLCQSLNVSITGGNGSGPASVWVLLDDDVDS